MDHSNGIWTSWRDGTFRGIRSYNDQTSLKKGNSMRKTLMAAATVATLAVAAVSSPAQAQRGVGAGIAAGLLGGAIIGGAIASNPYYGPGYYGPRYYGYGPGYGYYGGPAYVGGPYGGPCYWQRQRFWNGYGWRMRSVRVCD
jgi:hypothetical protein